jgi:radical SAM protein with 4Fe4S-binding SPASM domain
MSYLFEKLVMFIKFKILRRSYYFCEEPWIGIFSVRSNGDVRCCPCYAQVKIGNIYESSMHEIWNAEELIKMRKAFRQGELPDVCKGQLCPVVVGKKL